MYAPINLSPIVPCTKAFICGYKREGLLPFMRGKKAGKGVSKDKRRKSFVGLVDRLVFSQVEKGKKEKDTSFVFDLLEGRVVISLFGLGRVSIGRKKRE